MGVCTLIGGNSRTVCMVWRLYLAVVISQFLCVAALVTSGFSLTVKGRREMEKYLVPDQVGEGDITDQWLRFKKEFALFLTALGKDKAESAVKLAMFLRVVGPRINDMSEA